MLHNKILDGVTITELNKTGAFFKVLNCQTELTITMTRKGSNVMRTEVRSGFELSNVPFDKVIIESDVPQKVEIWASEYPLGYDAPTKGSNTNLSGIIEHYGDSQKVLPFERSRVAVTLFSDTEPFWYGGEGVTPENGIPVPAGERRRIEGAGELHLAISLSAQYTIKDEPKLIETSTHQNRRAHHKVKSVSIHSRANGLYFYTGNGFTRVSGFDYIDCCESGGKIYALRYVTTTTHVIDVYDTSMKLVESINIIHEDGAFHSSVDFFGGELIASYHNTSTGGVRRLGVGGWYVYATTNFKLQGVVVFGGNIFASDNDGISSTTLAANELIKSELLIPSAATFSEFSVSGSWLVVRSGYSCKAYDFSRSKLVILPDSLVAIAASGGGALVQRYSSSSVELTRDGNTFSVVAGVSAANYSGGTSVLMAYAPSVLLYSSNTKPANENYKIISFEKVKEFDNPKAKIRMLKEVV